MLLHAVQTRMTPYSGFNYQVVIRLALENSSIYRHLIWDWGIPADNGHAKTHHIAKEGVQSAQQDYNMCWESSVLLEAASQTIQDWYSLCLDR